MPADVAARMSRVIDRLGDETPAARPAPRAAEVIPISATRRRRVAGLLAAAAAIVVGGVVIQNVHLSSEGSGAATSAGAEDRQGDAMSGNEAPGSSRTPTDPGPESGHQKSLVKVHPRRFTSDALRARQLLRAPDYAALDATGKAADCVDVPRHARAVRATYKRAPAALVFQRPRGGSQVVDLYVCHSTEPIRSTTLSVP